MSQLADAKSLLTTRYPLVFGVTLVVVTALVQLPRLGEFAALLNTARNYREQSLTAKDEQATLPQIARWSRNVPNATMAESSQFLVSLEQLAMEARCDLGNTSDQPVQKVESSESLDMIDANVEVFGAYDALVQFLNRLKRQDRVLAVTRADFTANEYPRLRLAMTLRRYVRSSALGSSSAPEKTASAAP